ncbi:hypothetical protein PTSG_06384 [Salpingoeca rosetta]|uniref:Glutamate decarboxylase n=1 Tax=Salpingoeca rosetta (strain ATCC 50818 / BSB-021) TaxID=946362 RepID=F2UCR6_SALR5|nr:uncharacterized protein PTSG_06384 [Salpingoeca rosetta]EGD74373.1 hypothetical protein PTSG_06384 [Salpingoeca rosetta]|eukprot:XP_004993273.1 hypothetical protein PTSG_06384 [Salpingoeca rosetta]
MSNRNMEGKRQAVLDQADELEQLLAKVTPRVVEYIRQNADVDGSKVVEYVPPEELKSKMGIELPEEGTGTDEIVERIDRVLKYSVRTGHPRFLDKLYAGSDPVGQVSEFLTAVVNTNVYTYAVAPVFTLMELEVLRKVAAVVGFDDATMEGMLVPGGSFANFVAMVAARHHAFPHVRMDGWKPDDKPIAFCPEQAHYSLKRAAMMVGIGMNGIVGVKCDRKGRMIVSELDAALEKAVAEGKKPFFVSTSAGSTVMGGFDPFVEIRQVCDKYNVWMHVDAAWGIASKFTPRMEQTTAGLELADSCTWDGHKSLGMPIFAAAVMTQKHQGLFHAANSSSADYLFHSHEQVSYDLGDMTLQCGRRADSIKMWFAWLRHGTQGFRDRIEKALDIVDYMVARIKADPRFKLVEDPMYTNVCFWYLPPSLRDTEDLTSVYPKLGTVTSTLCRRMQEAGTMLVNINPLGDHGLPHFFRLIINNTTVTTGDMDFVLEEMDRLGSSL